MLVALDNAQLSSLEVALRGRPLEAADFIARWSAAGAVLALSATDLAEIAQRPSFTDVERRLEAVQALGPLRYAGPPGMPISVSADFLFVFEALHEHRKRRSDGTLDEAYAVFGRRLWRRVEVAEVLALAQRDRLKARAFLRRREMQVPFTSSMRAWHRSVRKSGTSRWPLPGTAKRRNSGRIPPRVPFPFAEGRLPAFLEFEQWVHYVETIATGLRDYQLRVWGLNGLAWLKGKPVDDFASLSNILYLVVLPYVRWRRAQPTNDDLEMQHLGFVVLPTEAEVRALNFYGMPGTATYLAVMRAQHHSGRPEETGDFMDADRAAFAPYVDLFFADRRTVLGLEQERRDRGDLLAPDSPPMCVRRSGDLASTIRAVEQRRIDLG